MKLSKIIAAGTAVLAAFAMVSCGEGDLKSSGTKYNLTVSQDATSLEDTEDAKYQKRDFKQLGSKEKVQAITEDVTIYGAKAERESNQGIWTYNNRYAVAGFGFDFNEYEFTNEDTETEKGFDFCLIGYRPETKKAYLERYVNVTEKVIKNQEGDSLGDYYYLTSFNSAWSSSTGAANDWFDVAGITVDETTGDQTFQIAITQDTPGTYVAKLGETTLGSWSKDSITGYSETHVVPVVEGEDAIQGGVVAYAMAPAGTKITANYKVAEDADGERILTGVLYEADDAEFAELD